MRQLLISLTISSLAAMGIGCCSSCDVCSSVGGPCGFYSLAGRELPPPIEAQTNGDSVPGPAQIDPYPVPPPLPTGPTAPDIK